jgi:DNA-binding IclR family transcriptional regulator
MPVEGKKYFQIASMEKGLNLLELLADHDELTVTEAARLSGLNRAGCHRYLATLKELGWVDQNDAGRYHLTFRVLELGMKLAGRHEIRRLARPLMLELSAQFRETVNLGHWNGKEIIHLDKVDSREILRMDSAIGAAAPAYCTGLGKAVLAFLPADELEEYLSTVTFQSLAPNTIVDPERLKEELERTRAHGFAVDDEELALGLKCVAAPIFDYQGRPVYSLSVAGPAMRLPEDKIEPVQAAVKETCRRLTVQLGGRTDRVVW